jgi:predicted HicB family RNase H-like nuclease
MSQTLGEYKGYNGSVLYSAEDRVLHGRIVGIRDAITFEGENVRQLEANFKAAVDEYLQFCKEQGKTPDAPFKGTFNVRVGTELHKRAALYAEEHGEKLNKVVHDALEEYLAHAS